jgi:hypothetical protein
MGGGGSDTMKIRYAGYIENRHERFLDETIARRTAGIDDSPYTDFAPLSIDDGFFGVGYTLASFPSLYDMYGKFMAGLDVDVLYSQTYSDLMEGPVTRRLISAEAQFLADELESDALPRFETGMMDLNAVVSSTFVMGRALLEEARLKNVEKYSAGLQYALLPIVTSRWQTHLEWNKGVVATYAEVMKLYFGAKMDIEGYNQELAARDKLWPFTVLEFERAALGTLQGATSSKQTAGSRGGNAISGALSGAAMGGMATGTPMGAILGGVVGFAGGVFNR